MNKRTGDNSSDEPKAADGEKGRKGSKSKPKKSFRKTASLFILGSVLLNPAALGKSDYELSFLKIHGKTGPGALETSFVESSRAAKEQSESLSIRQSAGNPEEKAVYIDSILLDLKGSQHQIAISDCGFCACHACVCPDCSCKICSSCSEACGGDCGSACYCNCDCGQCACNCSMECASCAACACDCLCSCIVCSCACACPCTSCACPCYCASCHCVCDCSCLCASCGACDCADCSTSCMF